MEFKVSDLVEINKSSVSKKNEIVSIKYLDTSNLTENTIDQITVLNVKTDKVPSRAKRIVRENDILISTVRPNQKHYGIIDKGHEDLIVSTGFAVLTPNEEMVNPYFLYKSLTTDSVTEYLQTIAENSTSTYPSIKPVVIGDLKIKLPSRENQNKIGRFLKNIDSKIEINSKIISNLEQLAQTLFKRWFVEFEFPNEDGEPYKSSGGVMVESEFGMIPESWSVGTLGEIGTIGSGKRPKVRSDFSNNDTKIPLIGASKIMGYTDELLYDESIVVIGRVGTHGVIQRFNQPCWPSDNTLVIKSKYLEFVYQFLRTVDYESLNRGSTQPLITQTDIKGLKLIMATKEIFEKFEKEQTYFSNFISNVNIENDKLIEFRDTITPKLLTGKLELPNEIEVNEHVPI